tara:strand:- start:175 stop:306 length:132 start_codon:yes stop_codon:yes gene_type:complete
MKKENVPNAEEDGTYAAIAGLPAVVMKAAAITSGKTPFPCWTP